MAGSAQEAEAATGAVTGILNRLERAGYVSRGPAPTDRRRVRVAAQPSAITRVQALYEPNCTRLTDLLSDYSADEVALLNDWFTRAGTLLSEYFEELRRRD